MRFLITLAVASLGILPIGLVAEAQQTADVKRWERPAYLTAREGENPQEEFKKFVSLMMRSYWQPSDFLKNPTLHTQSRLYKATRVDLKSIRVWLVLNFGSYFYLDFVSSTTKEADKLWALLNGAPTYFMINSSKKSIRMGLNTVLTAIPFSGGKDLDYEIDAKEIRYWDFATSTVKSVGDL